MARRLRPPFVYYGAKQQIAPRIVELFPEHEHYVEPFAGSLSVLLAKPEARMETVNDLDGDVMTFWRVLRERPDEFERACALTPHSRAESLAARDRPDGLDELERARRVWVALTQRRGGQLTHTGWRHNVNPAGNTMALTRYLDGYLARFAPAVERLRRVSLECRPALDVIHAYGQHDGVLLYVDPPYLASVRGGRHASHGYQHEMKHGADHAELAAALRQCAAAVVLSGYPSELYDELYAGWHQTGIRTYTGQGNGDAAAAARTEMLWSNRPLQPAA